MPANMLQSELKLIIPAFWKEYKKHITNFTKSNLMRNATAGDTWKTNLGLFLNTVVDISDGKAKNTISTQRRAKQLEKSKKCDLLSEFVKADRSEWLAITEEGQEDELDKVRSIFMSNGTEISSHKRWVMNNAETAEVKISFELTRAITESENGENEEEWWGPSD